MSGKGGKEEEQMKKMMMKKAMMFVMALAVAMPLMAATENIGGYTWTYYINNGAAGIYNSGSAAGATRFFCKNFQNPIDKRHIL